MGNNNNKQENQNINLNIAVLGDKGTGKSKLIKKFAKRNNFLLGGEGMYTNTYHLEKNNIHVLLYECNEEGRKNHSPRQGTNCALIVYDVTHRASFEKVSEWVSFIETWSKDVVFELVGNKCDLIGERVVSHDEANEFVKKSGFTYTDISAKLYKNVEESILSLVKVKLMHDGYKDAVDAIGKEFKIEKEKVIVEDKVVNNNEAIYFGEGLDSHVTKNTENYKQPISYLKFEPQKSCQDYVVDLGFQHLVEEINNKLNSKIYPAQPELSKDEKFALLIYHWEYPKGDFSVKLNNILRDRNPESMKKWEGYLNYFQSALSKLPNYDGKVYKYIPQTLNLEQEFQPGRKFYFISYILASKSIEEARKTLENGKGDEVVIEMKVLHGKDISNYVLNSNQEILVSPNTQFSVKKSLQNSNDGARIKLKEEERYSTVF